MAADIWLPIARDPAYDRSTRNVTVLGSLRRGVAPDAARKDMARVASESWRGQRESTAGLSTVLTPLREQYVGPAKPALFAMMTATALVLLVTCANVAG